MPPLLTASLALLLAAPLQAADPCASSSGEPASGVVADLGEVLIHVEPRRAQAPPSASAELQQRKQELDSIIEVLEEGKMDMAFVKRLGSWSQAFRTTVAESSLKDALVMGGEGAGGSMLASYLVSGSAGVSSAGVGAMIGLYVQAIKDGLHNMAGIFSARDNTALYTWVIDHVEKDHQWGLSRGLESFLDHAPHFLQNITGEAPPGRRTRTFAGIDWIAPDKYNEAEVKAYLARHSTQILFFIWAMETTHGQGVFPRYMMTMNGTSYRYTQSHARRVLQEKMLGELRQLSAELGQAQRRVSGN